MISKTNTHWVFVCGINSEALDEVNRHILDIAFGVESLTALGVKKENIDVLVDHQYDQKQILSGVKDASIFKSIKFKSISNYKAIFNDKKSLPNLAIIVVGHGGYDGIDDAKNCFKPYELQDAVSKKVGLEYGFVIFGQCYSGVYDCLNLADDRICFYGATRFSPSISFLVHLKQQSWVANYFVILFFIWLNKNDKNADGFSKDIDGDNKLTLLDSFKYVSVRACDDLVEAKKDDALIILKDFKELSELEQISPDHLSAEGKSAIEIKKANIRDLYSMACTSAEPWISNPEAAIRIEFAL